MIATARLRLHAWDDRHRDAFAALHADPEVMADLGGPIDRAEALHKLARYRAALADHGVSRWAVEDPAGAFLGYAGVMPRLDADHPLGAHHEIGWRFARAAWGFGYATEAAAAALDHAMRDLGLGAIVSYTAADNARSQAVMARLGFVRDPSRDFTVTTPRGTWRGLVWWVPTLPRLPVSR